MADFSCVLGSDCTSSNAGVYVDRCLMVNPQAAAIISGTVLLVNLYVNF
jgi:hypothetical protein